MRLGQRRRGRKAAAPAAAPRCLQAGRCAALCVSPPPPQFLAGASAPAGAGARSQGRRASPCGPVLAFSSCQNAGEAGRAEMVLCSALGRVKSTLQEYRWRRRQLCGSDLALCTWVSTLLSCRHGTSHEQAPCAHCELGAALCRLAPVPLSPRKAPCAVRRESRRRAALHPCAGEISLLQFCNV